MLLTTQCSPLDGGWNPLLLMVGATPVVSDVTGIVFTEVQPADADAWAAVVHTCFTMLTSQIGTVVGRVR